MLSRRSAFTLIELLLVIAIIGILATLVVTQLGDSRRKARNAQAQSDISEMGKAVESFKNEDLASEQVISNVPGSIDQLQGSTGSLGTVFTGTQTVAGAASTYSAKVNATPSSDYIYRYFASQTPVGATARQLVSGPSGQPPYSVCTTLVNATSLYYCASSGQGPGPVASATGQTLSSLSPAAQNGLVQWYVFNGSGPLTGTVPDASNNGNAGTMNNFGYNSPEGWRTGVFGTGLGFTQSDSISSNIAFPTAAGTLSLWFNPAFSNTSSAALFLADSTVHNRWQLFFNNGTFSYYDSAAGFSVPATFASNTWHHIVTTWGASSAAMYFDGQLIGSSGRGAPQAYGGPYSFSCSYTCVMQDARIYSRALSQMEIQKLYQGTL